MSNTVYVGLDVGCKHCALVALDGEGTELTGTKFPTSERNLILTMRTVPGEAHVHLEASELAAWIRVVLRAQDGVARVVVGDPKANAWVAKDPLKGDRLDAFKLAELLRLGRVHEVYYEDDEARREFRQIVRHYDDVSRQQARLKQKIKARFRAQGIIVQGEGLYSRQGRQPVLERLRSPAARQTIEALYRLLDETREAKAQAQRLMAQQARQFPEIARLREVPGVGLVCASRFVAYVQNPHRFSTVRKLWRYSRLGITDRSSDGKRLGYQRLDRYGNGQLKDLSRTVFENAMRTKEDNMFKRCHRRSLASTHNDEHARLTTQRKILAVMRAIWKEETRYCDEMG